MQAARGTCISCNTLLETCSMKRGLQFATALLACSERWVQFRMVVGSDSGDPKNPYYRGLNS